MSQFTGLLSATGLGSMGVVTAVDVTPNAVDWNGNIQNTGSSFITNGQQITGIASTITLKLNVDTNNLYGLAYAIRAAESPAPDYGSMDWISITSAYPFTGDTDTFTVSNNDWLWFYYSHSTDTFCVLSTISVINVSDGNAVLDTFQARLRPRGGSCP